VRRSGDLRWHGMQTMSHDDRFRHSSNIKDITSAKVLVLLMGGIYDICHWDGLIHIKFHKNGSDIRKLIGGNTYRHTDRKMISQAYFHFFQTRESRLKIMGGRQVECKRLRITFQPLWCRSSCSSPVYVMSTQYTSCQMGSGGGGGMNSSPYVAIYIRCLTEFPNLVIK
jgi:hypothetical protein